MWNHRLLNVAWTPAGSRRLLGPLLSWLTWIFFLFPGFKRHEIIESEEFAGVVLIHHVDLYLISFGFGEVSITYGCVIKFLLKLHHTVATSPLPPHMQLLKLSFWDAKIAGRKPTKEDRKLTRHRVAHLVIAIKTEDLAPVSPKAGPLNWNPTQA